MCVGSQPRVPSIRKVLAVKPDCFVASSSVKYFPLVGHSDCREIASPLYDSLESTKEKKHAYYVLDYMLPQWGSAFRRVFRRIELWSQKSASLNLQESYLSRLRFCDIERLHSVGQR